MPSWGRDTIGLGAIVGMQVGAALAAALVWGLVSGPSAALSALAGGACCFVPSALFAWRLAVAVRSNDGSAGTVFIVGEFAKLGLTVALLGIAATQFRDALHWPGLLTGVIVTLKTCWIALLFRTR
jgi:ATP synthase protein I